MSGAEYYFSVVGQDEAGGSGSLRVSERDVQSLAGQRNAIEEDFPLGVAVEIEIPPADDKHDHDSSQLQGNPTEAAATDTQEVFHGDLQAGRKRKKKATPGEWQRVKNKKRRERGEAYVGFRTTEAVGKWKKVQDKPVPAKHLGPRCTSKKCLASNVFKCGSISEEARESIFKNFWEGLDWGQKKVYVCSHVDYGATKRKTTGQSSSRRTGTMTFHLKVDKTRVRVCKSTFLNTICIGRPQLSSWVMEKATNFGIPTASPTSTTRVPKVNAGKVFVSEFFELIPKLPSHYRRKESTKLYLEPTFTCKSQLFEVYKEKCIESNQAQVSRFTFEQVFEEKNLSIFKPKKDQCDICCGYKAKNVEEQAWQDHILKKDRSRVEKESDKKLEAEGSAYVLTMDLESVKLSPNLKASALYYKTKLIVHNFTVYNICTHEATCNWWNETEGDLVASVYASCLIDFLDEKCTANIPIFIYSDGCTAQNRNAAMSNALLHYAQNTGKQIIQKYLEKGHTQMECDSVHSAIN